MSPRVFVTLLILGLLGFGGSVVMHQFGFFTLSEAFEFQAMLATFVLAKVLFWILILSGKFSHESLGYFVADTKERLKDARTPRS